MSYRRPRWLRPLVPLLASAIVSACGAGDAPVAVPPPRTPPPLPSELVVGYYSALAAYRDPASLQVVIGEGAGTWRIGGRDLLPPPHGDAWRYSVPLDVPTSGRLPARVALVAPNGDTLAAAALSVRLAPNHRFGLSVYIPRLFPRGPYDFCLGEVVPVAIRGSERAGAADTMFVMAGGLTKGAIC